MALSPFFTVHTDLPREGPGEPADVFWTLEVADTPEGAARICDIACGPGADIVTFAKARSKAKIDGVDITPHFVEEAQRRTAQFGVRVTVAVGDYMKPCAENYDLIWCAGAAYFAGFENMLKTWRARLMPGGAIAFSEPVYLSDPPIDPVRAFWGSHKALSVQKTINALRDAGWVVIAQRLIIGAPWAAYYDPMRARLKELRAGKPDAALVEAIEEAEEEIAQWDACPDEIAYGLFVVRPK
jgi:trans-aconitate methyltransferase